MPSLPLLLPLSLSPQQWLPGQHRHSCTDEQQASSDTSGKWDRQQRGRQQQGWQLGALLSLILIPQPGPCHAPQRALPPLQGCSTWASSCSPTCPWCHSLFARHYFYQNFREVLSHSSPGIYLGLLMSRQHRPCQALPAREDKRALPPHGDRSSPPARLGTAGWLSSWGLLAPAQAGGTRHCTVGPMVVVVGTGRQRDGGKHRGSSACQGAKRYQW